MKLIAFLVLLALAAPYVAMAQSNSTNGTCSACQQFFVVTGQNLYRIDGNGTKTLCESDFCFATGVTVNKNGTVFVADEGAKAIYSVPATCDSNKTLVAKNDGKFTSWLHPHDITVDDENNLYVSMMDFDPLWPLYPLERQVLAKEKHVYKLSVDENFNFTGKFSILAGGINNGRDIVHVRWSEDGLWGTRRNRFVAKFVNNLWEDWLGPNNDFRISEDAPQLLSLHQIDPGFSRCGYLAIASDAAKQFYTCSNFSDVSSCNSSCPASQSSNSSLEANLIHRAAGQCVSDDCIGVQSTTLSFDQTDNSGGNQNYSSQAECNNLLIPYSVVIDCECNLMVGDFAAQSIYKFSNSNSTSSSSSSSSSNSSQSLSFSSEGSVVEFSEPVFGMALFLPKNCSSSSSSSD